MSPLTPGSILERVFQVDPKVARVILIGLAVLAAVALVGSWGLEAGNILPVVIWLAVGYVMFAFLANIPGWLSKLVGTVASLAFIAYVGLFAIQLVSINRLNPPIMVAGCFFAPNQQGCPLRVLPTVERVPVEVAAAEPADAGAAPGDPAVGGKRQVRRLDLGVPSEQTAGGLDLSDYTVFVQYFPRRIDPEQADELARGLASGGWTVAEDVEALSSAFGVNEVRYFHREDAAAAQALASAVTDGAPWEVDMRVRDFSQVKGAGPGLLEVWVGG